MVAHDLHPEYLSTKHALELEGVELVGVQHHHAHLAACLAEHGEPGPAVGAIFDGTGYGEDGTVWGGELLFGGLDGLRARRPAVPGADAGRRRRGPPAVADGVRVARRRRSASRRRCPPACAARWSPSAWRQVAELARTGVASPLTTSAGRLFDAVAALCGMRAEVNYEGQAAIELEAACDPASAAPTRCRCRRRRHAGARRARRRSARSCADLERGVAVPRSSRRASTTGSPPRPRRACARAARAPRHRHGRAVGRRLPEPAPARAHGQRCCATPGCAC